MQNHKPTMAIIDIVGLPYDGSTLSKRGLGGSESCVIQMSREMTKLGFSVTVFNACDEEDAKPGWYDDVEYVPLHQMPNNTRTFDVVLASRTCYPFMKEGQAVHERNDGMYLGPGYDLITKDAKWKMIWMHDTFMQGDLWLEELLVEDHVDEILTLSDFHTSYVLNCHHGKRRNFEMMKNKVYVGRNCMTRYLDDDIDITQKDRNLFVYNASVSKGMTVLLDDVWPKVRQHIPDAKLKIVGGFYRFRESHGPDEQEKKWMALRETNEGKNGVEFTGIIRQDEIARLLADATWFIYPTEFPETFGISTLEAQAYNCVPLTTRFGALEEVAMDLSSYKADYSTTPNVLFENINKDEQVDKFVKMVVDAYNNPYLLQQKQYYCNAIREVSTWDTMAIQLKQHLYRVLGWYLPIEEHRRANWISSRVHQLFGRTFSNREEWHGLRGTKEKQIVVVSPFRNASEYLLDHIRSVAYQDYTNWKHILIDDASDDSSQEVFNTMMSEIGEDLSSHYQYIRNNTSNGAVCNQIQTVRQHIDNPDAIVILLDGDDALVNDPDVFHHINAWHEQGDEFTYGSCWSLADNIPLIAQPYPKQVRDSKSYRNHRFTWGIPYTHLRTFRRHLLDRIPDSAFQDDNGEWYRAGGDVAVFYNLIESADPDRVRAVADILVRYNDVNPANDYKIYPDEQNRVAEHARNNRPVLLEGVHENSEPQPITPVESQSLSPQQKKRILIGIPTAKYIEVETFKGIYDLEVPDGYEVDFQYFYGYSRMQILNLMCEWSKGYDYTLFMKPNVILSSDTLKDIIESGSDVVSVDDALIVCVKSSVVTDMIHYPHFETHETEKTEMQEFIRKARDAGATFAHIVNKTKTKVSAIV